MRSRPPLILLAALAATGCNMADDAGKRGPAAVANAAQQEPAPAPVKPERRPSQARLDELDLPAEPASAAKPGGVTRSWFAGNWTDTSDCADAGRFEGNGTYRLADGTRGMWNIVDGRLVVQHAGGRSALRLRRIDQDTVEVVNEDGSVGRSTRCG
jgi:hypothetical protein